MLLKLFNSHFSVKAKLSVDKKKRKKKRENKYKNIPTFHCSL